VELNWIRTKAALMDDTKEDIEAWGKDIAETSKEIESVQAKLTELVQAPEAKAIIEQIGKARRCISRPQGRAYESTWPVKTFMPRSVRNWSLWPKPICQRSKDCKTFKKVFTTSHVTHVGGCTYRPISHHRFWHIGLDIGFFVRLVIDPIHREAYPGGH